MNIPDDPFMLLSFINMKLRDNDFESLEELCNSIGCDQKEVINKLKNAGFEYQQNLRQFR